MIVSSGAMGAAAGAGTAWPKPSEEKQRASNTALVWRGRERGAGVLMGNAGATVTWVGLLKKTLGSVTAGQNSAVRPAPASDRLWSLSETMSCGFAKSGRLIPSHVVPMATPTPATFSPLHSQVAAAIRHKISGGVWARWLPAERALAAELRVSRRTLRKALAHLRGEGTLRTSAARGHAILPGAATRKSRRDHDAHVVFLSPVPLEELRPFTVLWVDQLRSLLAERRVQLRTLAGKKFFGGRARMHLARLVRQQPADAWLLAGSTETAQRWFQADGPPCVLAGSCHGGIDLPQRRPRPSSARAACGGRAAGGGIPPHHYVNGPAGARGRHENAGGLHVRRHGGATWIFPL